MRIEKSNTKDIDEIFRLYELATAFQKTKNCVLWPPFSRAMVATEIEEGRQFKLLINNEIACVWAIAFADPLIWKEKNKEAAIYLHRIATSPGFRGNNLVNTIVTWAKIYAKNHQKDYIRMDTVGENLGLIKHYKACGFYFLGLSKLKTTTGLPAHYANAVVSLFEMGVD
jgi:hypothetical protein